MTTQKTIEALIGKTVESLNITVGEERATIVVDGGIVAEWFYLQDCCATCTISQVDGDPESLIGGVIHAAYITRSTGDTSYGTETWTFIHVRATTGDVCFRFHGESNGYYSEDINCRIIVDGNKDGAKWVWSYPYD
jgi:hypothetical protein